MSYIYVMNIFSQSFTCFLLFLTMLSDEHFFKILMKFLKNILYFLAKKNFPTPNIQRYSSVFFHSFIVLAFRQFRSVVHLKFLCMLRGRNQIFFYQFVPSPCIEKTLFFPTEWLRCLGHNSDDCIHVDFGFFILFHWSVYLYLYQPILS